MDHVAVAGIVTGGLFFLVISLAGIFAWHRQEMAKLSRNKGSSQEMEALRGEIQEMRNLYSTLAVNVENLKDEVRSSGAIQDRIQH